MHCNRGVSSAFFGLLFLAALMFNAPAQAQAACQTWKLGSELTLVQTNNTAVRLTLKPTPGGFSGNANFGYWKDDDFWMCSIAACGSDYIVVAGPVVGSVNGDAFEATVYWQDNAVGVYSGRIGPQGLIVGTTFDKNNPSTRADFHSDRILECATAAPPAKPAMALGRVHVPEGTARPAKSICEYARSARERNSPAAPGLEKQCAAQKPAPIALGRVQTPAGTPVGPPRTMCEMAASARARNSPTAPALEKRCREEQAASAAAGSPAPVPAAAPAPAPIVKGPPVQRPHDLVIGPITVSQDGQRGRPVVVGTPVAIECLYNVNEAAGAFLFKIQPWQGLIQVGGQDPKTLPFQGDPQAGQHQARQMWTPTVPGRTPISCALNPGYEDAEANPSNNRGNEIVNVIADGEGNPQAQ